MRNDEAHEATAHAPHAPRLRRADLLAVLAVTALTVVPVSLFFAFAGRGSAGSGSSHPSTAPGTASPRGVPPPWMRGELSLAGTWLHWGEYGYYYDPGSPKHRSRQCPDVGPRQDQLRRERPVLSGGVRQPYGPDHGASAGLPVGLSD
ncbi:MAG TPA: hypothetical protein VGP82_17140 [Ktedonobacterales bacterium]|nr:hypothetical protein [Ktedonobacterales bacterium]